MKCPMCRQSVTCLLPVYTRAERQAAAAEYREIFTKISNYNKRFSGAPRAYWDYISDVPILLRHALNELFTLDGMDTWYRIRFGFMILVAFSYFLSPLDFIPEALFGIFGLIDDILVVGFIAIYACTMYRQLIANRR
jgi:RING finger protein 170